MVGPGVFVDGTVRALLLDCAEITGAVPGCCIPGSFRGMRASAKTGHGHGEDDHHHEESGIFPIERVSHASRCLSGRILLTMPERRERSQRFFLQGLSGPYLLTKISRAMLLSMANSEKPTRKM